MPKNLLGGFQILFVIGETRKKSIADSSLFETWISCQLTLSTPENSIIVTGQHTFPLCTQSIQQYPSERNMEANKAKKNYVINLGKCT